MARKKKRHPNITNGPRNPTFSINMRHRIDRNVFHREGGQKENLVAREIKIGMRKGQPRCWYRTSSKGEIRGCGLYAACHVKQKEVGFRGSETIMTRLVKSCTAERRARPFTHLRYQDTSIQPTPVTGVITALQSHKYRECIGLDWPATHPRNSDLRPQER